jgi:HK97 family phage prohead protease
MEMTPIHLKFSSPIEAADASRRIISGVVVPFNKVGHTSAGAVVFETGSIQIKDTAKIKLLAQHEPTNPIGRAIAFQTSDNAITGSFKISASQKGQDYLILASEDLIGGLSVGVDVIASKPGKDGTLYVQQAVLREVSLVESPAYTDAIVTQVAASAQDAEMAETVVENTERDLINQISEAIGKLKTIQDVEDALEETETETESEAPMSNDTAATTEASAEASRPTIKASTPYISTTVRHGITSKGSYVQHKIKAAQGDETSRLWISAAEDPANITAADTMSTNPAFNPIQYMKEFVSNTNFARPAIDAASRGVLPSNGMTFSVPSLVTSAGGGSSVAPTVAATAESGTPSSTAMTSAYLTANVTKYAGSQVISLELLERSDPIFFDELAIQLERAYLAATDQAFIANLTSTGTQATGVAATSAGLISYVSTESAAAYAGTSYFAKNLVAGVGQWAAIMGYTDSTGRPIYTASQPWNAAGNSAPTSIKGNVMGLDLFVDHNVVSTLIDESAFILAPEAVTWYESPTSYFSVNIVNNMQVQTAIYGYGAALTKIPAGIRRYNLI